MIDIVKIVLNPNKGIPKYLILEHNKKLLCYEVGDNFVLHHNDEFLKLYADGNGVRIIEEKKNE